MSDVFTLDSRPPNSTLQVTIVQIGIQNHDFYTFFALFSYDLSLSVLGFTLHVSHFTRLPEM